MITQSVKPPDPTEAPALAMRRGRYVLSRGPHHKLSASGSWSRATIDRVSDFTRSFRGGAPLAARIALRRARPLVVLSAVVISAREQTPSRHAPIVMVNVVVDRNRTADPIGGGLSRCSRRALVYSIDRDAISPSPPLVYMAPPHMINRFAWRLRCG